MSNVVQLSAYRRKTRKIFLKKHGARLDRFIRKFVQAHIDVDFQQVAEGWQEHCALSEASWDYVHLREVLVDALDEVIGKAVYEMLLGEFWFDPRAVSRSEIVERCLSAYVMGQSADTALLGN